MLQNTENYPFNHQLKRLLQEKEKKTTTVGILYSDRNREDDIAISLPCIILTLFYKII